MYPWQQLLYPQGYMYHLLGTTALHHKGAIWLRYYRSKECGMFVILEWMGNFIIEITYSLSKLNCFEINVQCILDKRIQDWTGEKNNDACQESRLSRGYFSEVKAYGWQALHSKGEKVCSCSGDTLYAIANLHADRHHWWIFVAFQDVYGNFKILSCKIFRCDFVCSYTFTYTFSDVMLLCPVRLVSSLTLWLVIMAMEEETWYGMLMEVNASSL